jgi:hypothetical protein
MTESTLACDSNELNGPHPLDDPKLQEEYLEYLKARENIVEYPTDIQCYQFEQ